MSLRLMLSNSYYHGSIKSLVYLSILGHVTALHQLSCAVAGWPPADAPYCSAGGVTPRKVFNVGHCGGGAAATVTALWMALQCPTADVRCITFGSPKAGNAAFTEAFRQASQVTCFAQSAGFLQLLLGASLQSSHVQHMQPGGAHLERQLQALCQGLLACLGVAHTAPCQFFGLHVSSGYGLTDTIRR